MFPSPFSTSECHCHISAMLPHSTLSKDLGHQWQSWVCCHELSCRVGQHFCISYSSSLIFNCIAFRTFSNQIQIILSVMLFEIANRSLDWIWYYCLSFAQSNRKCQPQKKPELLFPRPDCQHKDHIVSSPIITSPYLNLLKHQIVILVETFL